MTNVVVLMGNVVSDPDIRSTKSDKTVVSFRLANNRVYGDSEQSTFVDCTAFNATADFVADYLKKGSRVVVTGRLSQSNWTDKDTGENRSKLEIICERVDFAGSKPAEGDQKGNRRSGFRKSGRR